MHAEYVRLQHSKECVTRNRMCDILAPCWWCGKATKTGRRSRRWPGWASRYECGGRTWSCGSAVRCICSWLQWPRRELKSPTQAPACTGGLPVQGRWDENRAKIGFNYVVHYMKWGCMFQNRESDKEKFKPRPPFSPPRKWNKPLL